MYPYGMNPDDKVVEKVVKDVANVYDGCPETTCCHKAECCRAQCPNMYFSEFIAIRKEEVDKWSREDRLNLTIECVRRYLQSDNKQKPCVFLKKDNMCAIYGHRHLKCRLYGLIPDDMYERNVNQVASEMATPKELVPLCNQCQFVKVKPEYQNKFPDNKVPEKDIRRMEQKFRDFDIKLGLPKKVQDDGFGFLTYHDWHLMFELGTEWMGKLTVLRLKLGDMEKEQFLMALKNALEERERQSQINNGDQENPGQKDDGK